VGAAGCNWGRGITAGDAWKGAQGCDRAGSTGMVWLGQWHRDSELIVLSARLHIPLVTVSAAGEHGGPEGRHAPLCIRWRGAK